LVLGNWGKSLNNGRSWSSCFCCFYLLSFFILLVSVCRSLSWSRVFIVNPWEALCDLFWDVFLCVNLWHVLTYFVWEILLIPASLENCFFKYVLLKNYYLFLNYLCYLLRNLRRGMFYLFKNTFVKRTILQYALSCCMHIVCFKSQQLICLFLSHLSE